MDIEKLHNKKFNIFGSTWTIKIVDSIEDDKETDDDKGGYAGMTTYTKGTIEVARKIKGYEMSEEGMYNTLCHELVHAILDTGSYNEESYNEHLVEFLGRGIAELVRQKVICE